MFDQKTLMRVGVATGAAVAIAYLYGKMTARDDTGDQSSKYAMRAVILAVVSNLAAAYVMDSTTESLMQEPFYAPTNIVAPQL